MAVNTSIGNVACPSGKEHGVVDMISRPSLRQMGEPRPPPAPKLVARLQSRLETLEQEHTAIERKFQDAEKKLEDSTRCLRKRPGANQDEVREEIADIERKITTTSMKLVEEKTLIRRKEQLKARKKDIVSYEHSLKELRTVKDERTALFGKLKEKTSQVAEVRNGLRHLRLACKLGVAIHSLATDNVEIPKEAIGRVFGKRRAALGKLEEECHVVAIERFMRDDEAASPQQRANGGTRKNYQQPSERLIINIRGTSEGVAEARRRLEIVVRTVEVVMMEVPRPLVAALRAGQLSLIQRLQSKFCIRIYASRRGGSDHGEEKESDVCVTTPSSSGSTTDCCGDSHSSGSEVSRDSRRELTKGRQWAGIRLVGTPEEVEVAQTYISDLACKELVLDVEHRAIPRIIGTGGGNVRQLEIDFGIAARLEVTRPNSIVLMGIESDVDAAAERVRRTSDEFRETQEHHSVENHQVVLLLRHRAKILRSIQDDIGGGVRLTVVERHAPQQATPDEPVGNSGSQPGDTTSDGAIENKAPGRTADKRSVSTVSRRAISQVQQGAAAATGGHVVIRGFASGVSKASAVLLERLEIAERLTVKVPVPTEAVPFLVGKGGAYIRRLHNICLGCDVKLYRNTSEILVIADDAKRLEFALKIVERAVHHQEMRMVEMGRDFTLFLRSHRGADYRSRITSQSEPPSEKADVRGMHPDAQAGIESDGDGDGAEGLFGGVCIDILVLEGLVRLRGCKEELDRAEGVMREIKAEVFRTEVPIGRHDEGLLLGSSNLRKLWEVHTSVFFPQIGKKKSFFSVVQVPVPPSSVRTLDNEGGMALKKLSSQTATRMEMILATSEVRIRSKCPERAREAKRVLLRFVASQRVVLYLDLDSLFAKSSPALTSQGGKDNMGVDGGSLGGDINSCSPIHSRHSNELVRQAIELHGCKADFVLVPPPQEASGAIRGSTAPSSPSSSPAQEAVHPSGEDAGAHGTDGRQVPGNLPQYEKHERSIADGRQQQFSQPDGGSLASKIGPDGEAPGVRIWGQPGLVEKAREATVALFSNRSQAEVVLGAGPLASLRPEMWREIAISAGVTITKDERCHSLVVTGGVKAVETAWRRLHSMVEQAFNGRFQSVSVPREALAEVGSPLSLMDAEAAAHKLGTVNTAGSALQGFLSAGANHQPRSTDKAGGDGDASQAPVHLSADWVCSCIRVGGEAREVQLAVTALKASVEEWRCLEVSAKVEEWMMRFLCGSSGCETIRRLVRSLQDIPLVIRGGICRGRALSAGAAVEANRTLHELVTQLNSGRIAMRVASGLVNRLTGRGGASIMHLQRQCGVLISVSTPERSPAMEKGDGGSGLVAAAVDEEHGLVLIMGSSSAASAAKREVEGILLHWSNACRSREEMEIPVQFVPIVLGKGGRTIKSMSASTGAEMRLDTRRRKLTIQGLSTSVSAATALVQNLLESEPSKVPKPPVLMQPQMLRSPSEQQATDTLNSGVGAPVANAGTREMQPRESPLTPPSPAEEVPKPWSRVPGVDAAEGCRYPAGKAGRSRRSGRGNQGSAPSRVRRESQSQGLPRATPAVSPGDCSRECGKNSTSEDSVLQADDVDGNDVDERSEDAPESCGYVASRSSTGDSKQSVRELMDVGAGASAEAGFPGEVLSDSGIGTPMKESEATTDLSIAATSPSSATSSL